MSKETPSTGPFRLTLYTPAGVRVVPVHSNERLWDAAQAAGVVLPAICHQGRCLTCAGQLVRPGEFDSSGADTYFPQDRQAGFVLLCTAKPLSDLYIRTHVQNEMRQHRLKLGLPSPYS